MKLAQLRLQGIRNIQDLEIPCQEGIHYIYGDNGQGKTSILESIYILSNLKSFRESDLKSVISSEPASFARMEGTFHVDDQTHALLGVSLQKSLSGRLEKKAFINGKLSKSASDYFRVKFSNSPIQFHAVNLNPTSTDFIRRDPSYRRNQLNLMISSTHLTYLDHLSRYQKTLDQKNALLKSEGNIDPDLLEVFNQSLALEGAWMIHFRLQFLDRITQQIPGFLKTIAPDQEAPQISYFSKIFEHLDASKIGQNESERVSLLEAQLRQKFHELRRAEQARGSTLIGPHRDDVLLRVSSHGGSQELGLFAERASQGEMRSLLLALKLAELVDYQKTTGVDPVLLIDDFSSELDVRRRGFLLDYLKDSKFQIFVTATENLEPQGVTFKIERGKIVS